MSGNKNLRMDAAGGSLLASEEKGVQHLTSDYFIEDLGKLIREVQPHLWKILRHISALARVGGSSTENVKQSPSKSLEKTRKIDRQTVIDRQTIFLLNQAHMSVIRALKQGLRTEKSLKHWLISAWCLMTAAQVSTQKGVERLQEKYSEIGGEEREKNFLGNNAEAVTLFPTLAQPTEFGEIPLSNPIWSNSNFNSDSPLSSVNKYSIDNTNLLKRPSPVDWETSTPRVALNFPNMKSPPANQKRNAGVADASAHFGGELNLELHAQGSPHGTQTYFNTGFYKKLDILGLRNAGNVSMTAILNGVRGNPLSCNIELNKPGGSVNSRDATNYGTINREEYDDRTLTPSERRFKDATSDTMNRLDELTTNNEENRTGPKEKKEPESNKSGAIIKKQKDATVTFEQSGQNTGGSESRFFAGGNGVLLNYFERHRAPTATGGRPFLYMNDANLDTDNSREPSPKNAGVPGRISSSSSVGGAPRGGSIVSTTGSPGKISVALPGKIGSVTLRGKTEKKSRALTVDPHSNADNSSNHEIRSRDSNNQLQSNEESPKEGRSPKHSPTGKIEALRSPPAVSKQPQDSMLLQEDWQTIFGVEKKSEQVPSAHESHVIAPLSRLDLIPPEGLRRLDTHNRKFQVIHCKAGSTPGLHHILGGSIHLRKYFSQPSALVFATCI